MLNKRKRTDPRPNLRLADSFVKGEYRKGKIILLSSYEGIRKPNKLECLVCGFLWIGTYDGFKRHGNRCFQCFPSYKKRKIEIADCVDLAEDRGGFFLSKEYKGSQYQHRWKCGLGHIWTTTHASVRKGSWCPLCSKKMGRRESECRNIFEHLVGGRFPPIVCNGESGKPDIRNPKTGFPLRLDGFNEESKMAFEYQGEHHYPHYKKHPPYVTPALVKSVRNKDRIKKIGCDFFGIRLLVIPYWEVDIATKVANFLGGS